MVVGKSKSLFKITRKKIDFEVLNPTIFQFDCFSQLFTIFNQHRFVSNSCLFFTDTCRKKFPTLSWRKYVTVLVQILQLIFSKTEEFFFASDTNLPLSPILSGSIYLAMFVPGSTCFFIP